MKTIVAPTDFSPISRNAVHYAADLAKVLGTSLTLLHIYQIPVPFSEVPAPVYRMEDLEREAEEQMQLLKAEIMHRTESRINILSVVKAGVVSSEIESYCHSVDPYAVVMGAESAGIFERFLLGGKTLNALKNLSWPLIVVPPEVKLSGISKIGLACDLIDVAETVPKKEIRNLVKQFNATLHILHVSEGSGEAFDLQTIIECRQLQDLLEDLNPQFHFIGSDSIEKGICEFAEKNNLDLLIIIPKKRSLITGIFQHSHSKRLVLHAHVPVIAFHE
jgi:nucleotide-binding universal stress UspA family protein